jgi:hypothetical protein
MGKTNREVDAVPILDRSQLPIGGGTGVTGGTGGTSRTSGKVELVAASCVITAWLLHRYPSYPW